jgi:nucleoside-diphosphate-sugar epimerase
MNFIIYGASSWLGKATIYQARKYFPKNGIIAVSSSHKKIMINQDEIKCFNYEEALNIKNGYNNIFFNYAFILQDSIDRYSKNEYIDNIKIIRNKAINLIEHFRPKKVIYSSSGAVYSKSNVYGLMKSEDEDIYLELSKKLNYNILIPRIFNIGGVFINKDIYALYNLITQSITKENIEIKAKRKIFRSYVDVIDLINIIFSWAFDKKECDNYIFDSGNKKPIEILDLAKIILKQTGKGGRIERSLEKNMKDDAYFGDIEKQNYLTQKYQIHISNHEEIVEKTINYIKNANKS